MDVLITCPPMVGMLPELADRFAASGLRPTAAPVVQMLSEQELLDLVPRYDGWIIGDDPATARVFEAGRRGRLRAAVKWGVGVDNIDFQGAAQFDIPVANTPGMFGDEVADLAMSYVTGLARETFRIDRLVKAGEWPKPRGISLAGKVVALVGFGNIGRAVARRLLAAKMHVIAYNPQYAPTPGLEEVTHHDWPDQVDTAEFLVLACALTAENVHIVGRPLLARVKRGLRLVNVSRGRLIDEEALVEALASGVVHSAALDVFDAEPLPAGSGLRGFERCIFGSHNGSNTQEAVQRTSERAIELISGFLRNARL